MTTDNGLKLAQVGLGYWGKNLFRNFFRCQNVQELIACDQDAQTKKWLQTEYPHLKLVAEFESLLADHSLQAVVLATPADSHFRLAEKALLAGKHVFVEKPLALKEEEARRLVTLAHQQQRILMVGHTFLYNGAVEKVKSYLQEGMLGTVYYIYSQRLNLGRVRQDVNAMWNLAPHDISILLYWLDKMPVRVNAQGYTFIQPGVTDINFINLEFPHGVSAHIHVSWLDPNKRRNMTLVGSKKMIVYEDTSSDAKIRIYDKGITRKSKEQVLGEFDNFGKFQLIHRAGDLLIPKIDFREPLQVECEHFVDCVLSGQQPRTAGEQGLQVVRILTAAQKSLEQQGVPVEIKD